jgi:hypothetical protein
MSIQRSNIVSYDLLLQLLEFLDTMPAFWKVQLSSLVRNSKHASLHRTSLELNSLRHSDAVHAAALSDHISPSHVKIDLPSGLPQVDANLTPIATSQVENAGTDSHDIESAPYLPASVPTRTSPVPVKAEITATLPDEPLAGSAMPEPSDTHVKGMNPCSLRSIVITFMSSCVYV